MCLACDMIEMTQAPTADLGKQSQDVVDRIPAPPSPVLNTAVDFPGSDDVTFSPSPG